MRIHPCYNPIQLLEWVRRHQYQSSRTIPATEPLEGVSRGRHLPQSGPKRGWLWDSRVIWPLVGTRATHMVPEVHWAGNLLVVLLLWLSRLATIVSLREFDPILTSYRTHHCISNFPTNGANCGVTVFRPSPLQWICREWVRKLGFDKATICSEGEKRTGSDSPKVPGRREPSPED